MTTLHNVHVALAGDWFTGPWLGESAQFGVRLAFTPRAQAPSLGEIFTPQTNGNVVLDQGTAAGTHGTLTKTWTARIGPELSLDNANPGWQIRLAEAMWSFADSVKGSISPSFAFRRVRITPVDPNGKVPQHASTYVFTAGLTGTATGSIPPQLAMAVSLRSPIVGRRGRGRIFLGGLTTQFMATDGTIPGVVQTTVRTATKTLIDTMQAVDGSNMVEYMPIVSVMSANSPTAVRPSEIRTGNRLDTMQSRRRQVAETYTSLPL